MDKDLEISIKVAERSPYRLSLKVIVSGSAMSQGDLDTSYRLLMECLTFLPGYLPAQRLISVNRLLANDDVSALEEFKHLLSLNPSSSIGMFGVSVLQTKIGKGELSTENLLELAEHKVFGESSKDLLNVINSDNSKLEDSKYKTQVSEIIKEHKKTAHDMLNELGGGTDSIRLKLVLAELLLDRGEKQTAIGILKRLKDSHPNYPDLLNLLAKISKNENPAKAESIYQTIFDIQPTFPLPEDIKNSLENKYGNIDDIPAIFELDTWCETVLVQYAKQIIPNKSDTNIIEKQTDITEKNESEKTLDTANTDPVIFISDENKTEVQEESVIEPEKEKVDLSSVDSHQLQRARTILEQARKILDQTKKAPKIEAPNIERKPEPKIEKPVILENVVEPEINCTEPEISLDQPHLSDNTTIEDETIFDGEVPQRIVLPTSETQNEYTEESAWNLLKQGSAEEAFYMFSKLIRKLTGSEN